MLQNLFAWLRSSVRDAVLGGVSDALEIIDGTGTGHGTSSPASPVVEELRRRLTPALAGPSSVPAEASRVPQDEAAGDMTQTPATNRNGRKRAAAAAAE